MINIVNKADCCGCEACYNACPNESIRMKSDEEGFLYPQVNQDTCVNCGLCEKVCPISNCETKKNENQVAYLLQYKDDEVCKESTSGGAFTGIASYVIEKGGIVFGVEMTEEYKVRHTSVETIEELKRFRNSKYVQSRVGYAFQQVRNELKRGRMVCFSGTPCQIEGLRHFLGKDYQNLILVDVVCRAVPSPGVWEKYIQYEVEQKGKLSSIRFRDKSLGYQYSTMELRAENGKKYRGGIESQPWLRMFFSGMIIRPSCTDCRFRSRYRNSDFTIWDCFPSYKYDKSFDERKGTTRVLIHSEKGKKLCNRYRNVDNINDYCNMDLTNERICVFSGYDAVVHLLSDTQYIKPAMWDKLYKSSLFETLRFPNTFFEDAAITYKLLYTSKKIAYTEKQLYAYSVRGGSMITTPWSKKKSDSYVEITNEAISYFDERKEYKLAQAAIYWQIQFGIEAFERMLMNPKATQDDYNEVMTCVRAGYKRLKLSSLGFGLKKYLKKKLEFFLFTTNPRLLCKLKKKELR